jgi:hypothetical protein
MHLFDVKEVVQTTDIERVNYLLSQEWVLVSVIPSSGSHKDSNAVVYVLGRKKFHYLSDGWGESVKLD